MLVAYCFFKKREGYLPLAKYLAISFFEKSIRHQHLYYNQRQAPSTVMSYGERRFGGGNRFGGGGFGPKPVETGKEYDVQITETSRKGDGIARVQGFVIFVKDGKVGQNTKVKVTNVGARFATAEIVQPAQ